MNRLLNRKWRYNRSSKRGSVLIIVLWIMLGLVSLTLYFAHSMYFEFKASDNQTAGLQAEQALEGAARYVSYLLLNLEEEGRLPDPTTIASEGAEVGNARFWMLGRGDTTLSSDEPFFGILDESAKLNLNTATLEMLQALPNIPLEFAAAIVDWRDPDEDVSESGAESESYLLLSPPRRCKNAPFETTEELSLVLGATEELLYGEDTNLNGILDPNENDGSLTPPLDNQDGRLDFGLLEFVTVYSKPSTTQNNGENANPGQGPGAGNTSPATLQINVNTAPEEVLACLPGMDLAKAQQVVAYRKTAADGLDDIQWIEQVLDGSTLQSVRPYLVNQSFQYTLDVAAVGHHGRGYRRTRFVYDLSSGTPVLLYRRDLNQLGWALGTSLRNEVKSWQNRS